ncbi:Anaphase promoting complex subunit 7 [Coemansia sp. BCRC 34301]|nr:Anaphase promoting complex subunit 7 [Coemansia sp. BCRC 34301]
MASTRSLVAEIGQLVECDLSESALHLAELECHPLLSDTSLAASERLEVLRAYVSSLQATQQHRAALRATADFAASSRGQLPPRDIEALARDMAGLRWALGEADVCLAQLRQIPRASRKTRDWARMARCAAQLGHHDDARVFFAEVAGAQPSATEAVATSGLAAPAGSTLGVAALGRALALMRRFEYSGAAAELRRLARTHASARVVGLHASCLFQLGDDRQARILFERAQAMDDSLADGMGSYAMLLARTGDRLAVYALGRRLLRSDAQRPEGWVAMARFLDLSGRAQEALAVSWKAQALAPRCADAFHAEGSAQLAAGSPADAVAALRRAHALAPSAYSYSALVHALVSAGLLKDAFVYAREAAEKMPRHAATLALVGAVLSHSPESADKAERLLRAALEADRRSADAVDALAALYVAAARVPDAVALLETHAPEIATDHVYARLADVLTLANRLPEAAENYAAALQLNPDNQRARAGYDRVDRLMHPGSVVGEEEEEEEEEGHSPIRE